MWRNDATLSKHEKFLVLGLVIDHPGIYLHETRRELLETMGTDASIVPVKTVPRLHLAVKEKSQRRYTQQASNKRSVKSSCRMLHKHLPKYQLSDGSFFNIFSNSGELCSASLVLIFSDKSFY